VLRCKLAVNACASYSDWDRVALNRYQAGAVSYLDVVTAQSTALSNERIAADISRRQMDASVLLVKALGGLWAGLPAGTPVPQGS
jgi:outer membrane protein TolC